MTVLSMRENDIRTSTKEYTRTNQLEETSRTLIDIATGTDAYAQIQGTFTVLVYERIQLQFIYIIDIVPTYIVKYTSGKRNRNSTIKPAYHVQFNKISDDKVLVIRVNIDAFGMFLKHLEQTKHLEPYFNKYLEAYEFDLDNEAMN
jgi:hypothetical protein